MTVVLLSRLSGSLDWLFPSGEMTPSLEACQFKQMKTAGSPVRCELWSKADNGHLYIVTLKKHPLPAWHCNLMESRVSYGNLGHAPNLSLWLASQR